MKEKEKIKEYWEERAKQHMENPSATTDDVYLRELEISVIIKTINEIGIDKGSLLDVGCGDGYSILKVAEAFKNLSFVAIDYSENMIRLARQRLESQPDLKHQARFIIGDVTAIGQSLCGSSFDIVLTDRCLINLGSFEDQCNAIRNIANHTKKNGYYIAIENFIEGHENMNAARRQLGLLEIPVRWHNIYFKEKEFIECAGRFFQDISFREFTSSYYFATRVIYAAMCQMRGEKPDYRHEIHQLSIRLPWIGQFSPIRMAVMRKDG
ncbi:class I SAM-dependent methyltransferase [bacterium]|nr:class I SAM-dependent methyltransferase [bacterium]